MDRQETIKTLISQKIKSITHLEVIDDGHLHKGHEGAKTGKGHFTIRITSDAFKGLSPIEQHRMIYHALGRFMHTDIHALRMDISF
jgi:BolA family transcriptional regulator, general stress-responsive regulator